ncbi:MAG: hypothetical protein ACYS22_07645 [Planctomycetota bacterium]|jgi:hypothetical protein
MATITKECSIEQGYNLEKDNQETIGHLTYLSIGGTPFTADQSVKVPGTADTTEKVVSIMSTIEWEGGYARPIVMSGQLSTANKQTMSGFVHGTLSNTEVQFKFAIYEYDPSAKVWFKTLFAEENLVGLVAKEGSELKVVIEDKPSEDVISPQNYKFDLTVMPKELEQSVHFATKSGAPVVLKWGVTIG